MVIHRFTNYLPHSSNRIHTSTTKAITHRTLTHSLHNTDSQRLVEKNNFAFENIFSMFVTMSNSNFNFEISFQGFTTFHCLIYSGPPRHHSLINVLFSFGNLFNDTNLHHHVLIKVAFW